MTNPFECGHEIWEHIKIGKSRSKAKNADEAAVKR